jgi:RNA polymerase sigma-70 factor, ECF subfamily
MDDERALMKQVARADAGAFAELVGRYSSRMLAVAGRLLGSRPDAEDAVQRALLQGFASAGTYRAEFAVSTWLYRILTNICIDELRRRAPRVAPHELPPEPDRGDQDEPDRYLDLHRALERVPRESRVLLALRYVDGLSYGELARIRGISINTVKSQLARGKALLRAELLKRGTSL